MLTSSDVDAVCGLVIDLCGVYLDESKSYLIESRLGELVKRSGCASYAEFARRARHDTDQTLRGQIVDAITTNETLFFRDISPFDALELMVIPEIVDGKTATPHPQRIRIWSAACSTGQEPYSIAMLLSDMLPDVRGWDVNILGTDISDDAIARASRGWYTTHEIERGMPPARLQRYFQPENNGWRVKDSLRALCSFERGNLLDPNSVHGKYDVIFCRNVAIYFTPEARRDLFLRLATALTPAGYLFVGSQESLRDLGPQFAPQQHCRAICYRPNLPAAPPDVLIRPMH
ncbi:MAG: protein-glutamate O-methyltransferase CheR [Pirellulales bacterium]